MKIWGKWIFAGIGTVKVCGNYEVKYEGVVTYSTIVKDSAVNKTGVNFRGDISSINNGVKLRD